ncbi:unnamed protein product, partial [Timema podura]|nr:unnamed protein product [Timema podura]
MCGSVEPSELSPRTRMHPSHVLGSKDERHVLTTSSHGLGAGFDGDLIPPSSLFLAMEYTAANLEQAVAQFYHTDAAMRAQAHRWLTAAQMSPEAWAFVWELLHSSQSPEVLFFAATTLHAKVVKCWHEIPADQYSSLKKHILQATVNYCMGPKIVVNKLCIAVSLPCMLVMIDCRDSATDCRD